MNGWAHFGTTIVGMVFVAGMAWGMMRSQVREVRAMFAQLKSDSEHDRELCEGRCVERVAGAKSTATRANTRLDGHISQHPGATL